MWIYVENRHVLSVNPNNMEGNSGWSQYDGEITEPLFDEHGVPMYDFEDGDIRVRTEEEREADRPAPPPQRPTLEDVYAALEMLLNGVTGDE